MAKYRWRDKELVAENGRVFAFVRADILHVGAGDHERLLLESSLGTAVGFRARATSENGAVCTVHKASWTVHELVASCEQRKYLLVRVSPWRKVRDIIDARGNVVCHIRALPSGELEIETFAPIADDPLIPAAEDSLPLLDLAFLTYACKLVDLPTHNLRF